MDNLVAPSKAIRRIVQVMPDGEARTVFKKPKSQRKSSRGMKRLEKAQRLIVEAMQAGNAEYLKRHEKSSRNRRDGWILDMLYNTGRANEKVAKKLSKIRVF